MARKKIFGTSFYKGGSDVMTLLTNADVACYEAGTITAIPMYASSSGGTPFYPSPPGAGLKTNTEGYFQFWIEYEGLIKVVITKLGYSTITRDNIGTPFADMTVDGGSFA